MVTQRKSSTVPGPEDIVRQELPNGMVALVRENFTSPAVVVQGYLLAGSVAEPDDKAGLAGFTASLLTRGTENRTFEEINETVEGVGASLDISAGRHTARFHAKSLAEDLELILDVLADVLRHPSFPPEHVEKVRGQWLTDLLERDHDTRRMASLTFRELTYPNHPYGRSLIGYHETVKAIDRGDVVSFYRHRYGPRGGVVVVVGAVKAEKALALLERLFGDWFSEEGQEEVSLPPVPRLEAIRRKEVPMPGKTQTDIVLGWPGLSRTDPDFYTALLANTVLGQFGMYGRLGMNVREKQGLAYYCLSSLEAGQGPGPWYAFAGVNPANVQRAIESILAEMARMREELVPEEELNDSKAFLTGSLPLRLETNEGVAGALLEMERYGLGLDYLQRYPDLIHAVSAAEVQAVAAKYFNPEAYALALAGPDLGQGKGGGG